MSGNTVPRIVEAEHIGPNDTGDNIEAKRVANYVWDTGSSTWVRDSDTGSTDNTATGTISTQNLVPAGTATANSTVEITLGAGQNTLAIQTVGTYTGALTLQGTVDGTNWVSFAGTPILNANTGLWLATITSALQSVFFAKCSGFTKMRISANAAVTGSVVVSIGASVGDSFQGALGVLTTVTTVSTLTNITNWGNVVDNGAFVDGTTRLSPNGYIFDEVAGTALTENDAAAARIDSKRAQVFTLEDATTRGQRASVSSGGALKVDPSGLTMPTTLISFITDIPSAGTRVQLASNTVTNGVLLQAPSTNTGMVYVGGSTVSSTVFGTELQPGQSTSIAINNTNKIYVDTDVNGSDIAVIGS
jgi:hypothetical protein